MLNLKKLNLALCLSVFLISGATFATEVENKSVDAVDVLTIIGSKDLAKENFFPALGCTTTPAVCSRVAGQYGYPYYYAEVDYNRCNYNYPYACYGSY